MKNFNMNTPPVPAPARRGFTLIELLVVITIIAILAGLLLPVGARIMQKAALARVESELSRVDLAIKNYKGTKGFYPPDNPNDVTRNQLYYELVGCTRVNDTNYVTLDGAASINPGLLGVSGILNANGMTDDASPAKAFLTEIKPNQYASSGTVRFLGVTVAGPSTAMIGELNPFRYNSSHPTNNVNSFDLWVDVNVGGKIYRVDNWSSTPQILP